MQLIIETLNLALFIDPAAAVVEFGVGGWDVDADVYGEVVVAGALLEAEEQGGGGHGVGEGEGLGGGAGDVVCCFGEEEGLGGERGEMNGRNWGKGRMK